MKLFIISEVLYDYSSGMVAIKARDLADARTYFVKWVEESCPDFYAERYIKEFDTSCKAKYYHVLQLAEEDKYQPGIVTQIWGGG